MTLEIADQDTMCILFKMQHLHTLFSETVVPAEGTGSSHSALP